MKADETHGKWAMLMKFKAGKGNDTPDGSTGHDTLNGGSGDDTFVENNQSEVTGKHAGDTTSQDQQDERAGLRSATGRRRVWSTRRPALVS